MRRYEIPAEGSPVHITVEEPEARRPCRLPRSGDTCPDGCGGILQTIGVVDGFGMFETSVDVCPAISDDKRADPVIGRVERMAWSDHTTITLYNDEALVDDEVLRLVLLHRWQTDSGLMHKSGVVINPHRRYYA